MNGSKQEFIEAVFGSDPRTGNEASGFWWSTRPGDKAFYDAVVAKGKSVCLDGPTGSGKTSLAMRGLQSQGFRFARVPISPSMTWRELCKEVVTVPTARDRTVSFRLSFGLKSFVPSGNIDAGLEESMTPIAELAFEGEYLDGFSQHDLARLLDRTKTALLLDDFENAGDELVDRVASMVKILASPDYRREAKVVITAIDNAFTKMLAKQPTLRGRLEPVHLGGLPDRGDPWGFIVEGLGNLGIRNPATSRYPNQIAGQRECRDAVYDASAGILKDITALGYWLADSGFSRKSVTVSEITKLCDRISRANVGEHALEFRRPLRYAVEDPVVHDILAYLHSRGISRVHYVHDIKAAIEEKSSPDQVYTAIERLVSKGVLVQTGLHSGALFPRDAALLHALCLAASNPKKYGAPKEFYENAQFLLPLPEFDADQRC
jgi:ABC-type dipeptide/oligopeptide/nickel transport system ATPase subunit